MNALDIKSLCKTYKGKRGARIEALRDLTMEIGQGEVFGFLGPNGAGKSTTIKCLMGLISPTAGEASILGEPIGAVTSRMKVGFLPENPAFYDYLSAEEYLHFVGKAFRMPADLLLRRSDEALMLLDLWEARKRPMRGYSKGMVQRVGLAQTLIHDPDLFILDEPMSGLDPIGRALVKEIILDLKRRGRTVFFSTHITDDVEKICDRVGIIVGGQLRVVDSVESIMKSGIEGYNLQVSSFAIDRALFDGCSFIPNSPNSVELYVPREKFQEVMDRINRAGYAVDFIETKRKGLEAFFLEIVAKEAS